MMKSIYKILLLLVTFTSFTGVCFAASIKINTPKDNYDIGEEFYVDLILDTKGQSINGVEGNISFGKNLEFLRAENGPSFVNYWIESPSLNKEGKISFSGIIPAGFSGILNKTDAGNLGIITRLVFRPVSSGGGLVSTGEINITINDGVGTLEKINSSSLLFNITNKNNPKTYSSEDYVKPELTSEIIKDSNLENNSPTLAFNAIDKDSGVEGVYLKNKNNEWVKIQNPYVLNNDLVSGILTIKAVDYSGNETVKRFILPGFIPGYMYLFIIVLLILVIYTGRFIYKIYGKKV